jgi:alkylation response protein AidB-like acyl-CoA dehydrogenase
MEEFVKGGAFLIESISPQQVFTPEEFNEEQLSIAKAVTEFVVGEIQPVSEDIEEKKEGLLVSLLKKAGELGFLAADIPEEYGGQDLATRTRRDVIFRSSPQERSLAPLP